MILKSGKKSGHSGDNLVGGENFGAETQELDC